MNNRPNIAKLKGKTSQTAALKRNLLTDLVLYEHVETTRSRAKAIIPLFDKVINIAKNGEKRSVEAKLGKVFYNESATQKVMEVLTKRFANDTSGYVKLYKIGKRKGDSAEMVKMMVKGYEYKEIGSKATKKKTRKQKQEAEEPKQKFEGSKIKDLSEQQNQVDVNAAQGKAKSRSGI